MINSVDNYIHSLINSPQTFKTQFNSRIVAVALTALIPVEAIFRTLGLLIQIPKYVLVAPPRTYVLLKSGFKINHIITYEYVKLCTDVIKPVVKTAACIANIILSPLIAPFSPRAMIDLHIDCGLTTIATAKLEQTPPKKILSEDVTKKIDQEFLSFHLKAEEKSRLKEYGLTPPNSIVLYGPSASANKEAAQHIASQLNKNLKEIDKISQDAIDVLKNYNPSKEILYVNFPNCELITDKLDKGQVLYIRGSKLPLPEKPLTCRVQVEIPLPDAITRLSIIRQNLDSCAKEASFDELEFSIATAGLKAKKIEKLIKAIKLQALQSKNKITTAAALEAVARAKQTLVASHTTETEEKSDFVGMEELHSKFDHYLQILKSPNEAKEYGVKLPAGIILYGPPGCGKTYTAKHLCQYAASQGVRLNFREIKGSDIASKWKGDGVKNIRKIFDEAKQNAPTVLFIDECEGLFPSRDKLSDTLSPERTQELDEALQMIEQAKYHNVIVVGATNHISTIDSAILRTGRFDYTFEVKAPDEKTRFKLLEAKLKLKKCDAELDIALLAKETEGFTASDIETLVNDAGLVSWKGKTPISMDILMQSLATVKNKRASVHKELAAQSGQTPVMHDLKKGVDALRQFLGNLDSIHPEVAAASGLDS